MTMKRILSLFFACTLIAGTVTAQTVEKSEKTHQQVVVDSILKVVESIKTLQEESNADRDRVWKEKKEHRAKSEGENNENVPTQYGAMLQIEKNTHQNWCSDDWNLFGICTAVIAVLSFIIAWITYNAQKKTEKHTTNAPIKVQLWNLKDLPRHFYRNLVCTCAICFRYQHDNGEGKREFYPSESNLHKLEVLPDDVVLPIDIDDKEDAKDNYYKYMHELRLLFRNYNIEVGVASDHLKQQGISRKAIGQDFDNLLFKPVHLTRKTFDFEKALVKSINSGYLKRAKRLFLWWKKNQEEALAVRTISTFVKEHFAKLKEGSNFNMLLKDESLECIQALHWFESEESNYIWKSIDRSLEMLIRYGTESENKTFGIEDEKAYKSAAVTVAMLQLEEDKKGFDFFTALRQIENEEQFKDFYVKLFGELDENTDNLGRLFVSIQPYLELLKKDEWNVCTLLKHLLAIDTAIEINRIGMVNFA